MGYDSDFWILNTMLFTHIDQISNHILKGIVYFYINVSTIKYCFSPKKIYFFKITKDIFISGLKKTIGIRELS